MKLTKILQGMMFSLSLIVVSGLANAGFFTDEYSDFKEVVVTSSGMTMSQCEEKLLELNSDMTSKWDSGEWNDASGSAEVTYLTVVNPQAGATFGFYFITDTKRLAVFSVESKQFNRQLAFGSDATDSVSILCNKL